MLSSNQIETLDLIKTHLDQYGVYPTLRQLQIKRGVNSASGIHRTVQRLVAHGYLRKTHNGRFVLSTCCPTCGQKLNEGQKNV